MAERNGGAVVQEDPLTLLGRLRLGREEYCQRLLTMLILEDDYPRWNSRLIPSDDGLRFLGSLDQPTPGTVRRGERSKRRRVERGARRGTEPLATGS